MSARLPAALALSLAFTVATAQTATLTDPECQGPVHGRTRDVGEQLTVTMVSGSVAPGTRGVVCVPWTNGTQQGLRLSREVVAEASWSDQVRTRVTKSSPSTRLVPDATVTFDRVERPGSLTLDAVGGRAGVYAGDAWLGGTPIVLPLPPGIYTFEMRRLGFEPAPLMVEIREGAPVAERITLLPAAPAAVPPGRGGALRVTSTPAGATVWIDGVQAGVTPFTASALAAGPHELEARTDTLAAAPVTVDVNGRPQTVDLALGPQLGYVLLRTSPPGQRLLLDAVAVPSTPALMAVAPGMRRVSAEGSSSRSLTTPITVQPGLVTVALVPTETRRGWIDVRAPADAMVRLVGTDVGRGAMRLRVPAGSHSVTVASASGAELASETARVEDGATVVAAAGGAAAPAQNPRDAGGAVTVVDLPDAPAVAVARPAAPSPAVPQLGGTAPAAAAPTRPASARPPDTRTGEPGAAVSTAATDPGCTAPPVTALAGEAENRLYGGLYAEARACYVRLAQLDVSTLAFAQRRMRDIADARAVLEIQASAASFVPQLHARMLGLARTGDIALMRTTAGLLFQTVPNDPVGLVILRRAFSTSIALPTGDLRLAAVYVPGAAEQTPDDDALRACRRPASARFSARRDRDHQPRLRRVPQLARRADDTPAPHPRAALYPAHAGAVPGRRA